MGDRMEPQHHVLLVEDEIDDAGAIGRGLPRDRGFHVEHVRSAEDALEAEGYDAVVVDQGLPKGGGIRLVRELRRRGFSGPIVVVGPTHQESVADRAFEAGADDFVVKTYDYGDRLADAVRPAIAR